MNALENSTVFIEVTQCINVRVPAEVLYILHFVYYRKREQLHQHMKLS